MTRPKSTYTTFSVAAYIVWLVVLGIVALTHRHRLHTFALVFGGWAIGWLSASIARVVYPPPTVRWRGRNP